MAVLPRTKGAAVPDALEFPGVVVYNPGESVRRAPCRREYQFDQLRYCRPIGRTRARV
jgi:hypothetical protein